MGWFDLTLKDQDGEVVQESKEENTLHYDGLYDVFARVFQNAALPTWQIGISGFTPYSNTIHRPNYTLGLNVLLGEDTSSIWFTYQTANAAVTANEGGGFSDTHRTIMGYSRKPAVFTAAAESGGCRLTTDQVSFNNQVVWGPMLSLYDPNSRPPRWRNPAWEEIQFYPWSIPNIHPDAFCGTSECNYLATDLQIMGGFPIRTVFLVATSGDPWILASAQLKDDVLLRPELTLYVRYSARIHPTTGRETT